MEMFRDSEDKLSEWLLVASDKNPVIVFPVTSAGEVVAIKQFRHGANDVVLELPGGVVDGDSVIAAARLELMEETGHTAERVRIVGCPVWFDPSFCKIQFSVALATGCGPLNEPERGIEVVHVPIDAWYSKLALGEVLDAKTYVASMLVLRCLPESLREYALYALDGLTE